MLKNKRGLFFFLFFTVLLQWCLYGVETKEEPPVNVKFQNDSDHMVVIHVLSDTLIVSSQYLEPLKNLEIDVAFGNNIRLEYKPFPQRTTLSQLGSLNELYRTILIRNDGEHVFIEEKFSGQRVKGKGIKRIPKATVSDPELERNQSLPAEANKARDKKNKTGPEQKKKEKKKD
jgi:hypothetical protein